MLIMDLPLKQPDERRRPEVRRKQTITRDERKQSLIDAARELFTAKGYHATTIDDITRSAGIAKGTFYLYFSEKREIYYEVIESFMRLIKSIGASVSDVGPGPVDFYGRIEKAAHQLIRVFLDNRQLAKLAYRESMGLDVKLQGMLREFYRELADVEERNIQLGIDLGIVRPCEPRVVAYAHIGMVERVLLALGDIPDEFPEPAIVVKELMMLAFDGVRVGARS